MVVVNHYHVFKIKHQQDDNSRELYYVADGPANGRQLLPGRKPEKMHDQPVKSHKDLGGLVHLAHNVFELHMDYLNDEKVAEKNQFPYLGFSFETPYQATMWDKRIWYTEKLSDKEQIVFLEEMQKNYMPQSKHRS